MSLLTERFLFTPPKIANCRLWLDAADTLTIDGTTVTAWRDKSGNANNASFSGTNTYSSTNKYISTDGISSYFTVPVNSKKSVNPNFHVFMIYKWLGQAAGTNQTLWGNDLGGGWNRFQVLSFPGAPSIAYGLTYSSVSPNVVTVTGLNTANTILYSANYSFGVTNGSFAYVNGTLAATLTEGSASPETSTALTYFGQLGSSQYYGNVGFNEILIYTGSITTSQRQQVEGYLAWKWGLVGNLPSSHPFKTYRPVDGLSTPIPLTYQNPKPLTNKSVFQPTQISNLNAWYDGLDPLGTGSQPLVNTTLTRWFDKSGNNRHASGGAPPTFVSGGVSFGGTNWYSTSIPYSSNYSIFLVATNTTLAESYFFARNSIAGGREPTFIQGYIGSGIGLEWFEGSDRGTIVTSPTSPFIISVDHTQGSRILGWYFGAQTMNIAQTRAYNGAAWDTIGQSGINANYYRGIIKELLFYSNVVTNSQRQEIEGYLAWKWGLQSFLADGHPYKGQAISPFPFVTAPRIASTKFFNPRNISGLQFWLDAADSGTITNTASGVSQWNDKSPNAYNATQTVSGSRPTYSQRQITFANNAYLDFPQAAINNTTTYALFLVFFPIASVNWIIQKQYNGVGSYNMLSMTNYWQNNTGLTNYLYWAPHANTGTVNSSTALSLNTLQLIEVIYSSSTLRILRNGTLLSSTTSGPTLTILNVLTATNCTIGSWRPDGGIQNSGVTNFRMAEFIYFNTTVSSSQQQQIEGYLAWKWGLSLPASHPFAKFPPSP